METSGAAFSGEKAWDILCRLASMGKRAPGTQEHADSISRLHAHMKGLAAKTWLQEFTISLQGKEAACANICGFVEGKSKETILLGTHFDTRLIADNETSAELRSKPIPGVNDGTSGVAVLLELMRVFSETAPEQNMVFVLFDAEDVGNIDGHEFGRGAAHYAKAGSIKPELVIALDMVAGKDMRLNVDYNSFLSVRSALAFNRIFGLGRGLGYPCFFNNKHAQIIGDHYPFVLAGIPALILIDIDYPQWHTQSDTIDFCSKGSLEQIGNVLLQYFLYTKI